MTTYCAHDLAPICAQEDRFTGNKMLRKSLHLKKKI
jgi:hypothetical protein